MLRLVQRKIRRNLETVQEYDKEREMGKASESPELPHHVDEFFKLKKKLTRELHKLIEDGALEKEQE